SGYSEDDLGTLSKRLRKLEEKQPKSLMVTGDPLPKGIHWVKHELVAEIQFASWSGAGRVRQAVYLGLREDKNASEVVCEPAAMHEERRPEIAIPPRNSARKHSPRHRQGNIIVTTHVPARRGVTVGGVTLTHPDRELWPGITKQQLAEYWTEIADHVLS